MDSSLDVVAWWGLLAIGVLLVIPYVVSLWMSAVNEAAFALAVHKSLAAGDVARVDRLCVALDAPLGAATKAALATVLDGSVLRRDDAEDYRTAGAQTDPAQLAERLTRTFALAYDHRRRAMNALRVLAALGAVAFALVVGEHARRSLLAPTLLASILAIALLLGAANRDRNERRRALAMFATVRDALRDLALDPQRSRPLASTAEWTLVIEEPSAPPREYPMVERVIKIGRVASSHVRLEHDQVARIHAVLENADGALTLIDLGASAGTQVNGEAVVKRALNDGDRITIGPCTITVRSRG